VRELVSVIMSTYNEEIEWIKKSIDSILLQTYQHFEFIIVIDNPYNDRIKKMIFDYEERDNRIKVILNEENIGLVKSLNKALDLCQGKYVARMDADDISSYERLMKEKEYLEKNSLDFVFSGAIMIDENDNELNDMGNVELQYKEVKKEMERGNISPHPTWFLKREVYKHLGGYREIPYCEDYDLSLRALINGYKIGKINENLIKYRVRTNSITRTYSFEQFLITRKILSLYNSGKLDDNYYVYKSINELIDQMNSFEKAKFIDAKNQYQHGTKFLEEGKYFKGYLTKVKSCMISKYYFQVILNSLKNKVR